MRHGLTSRSGTTLVEVVLGLALFTAFASRKLDAGAAVARWLNRTIGALFVALGVRLALATR